MSWPKALPEISSPICTGVRCQAPAKTGSASAMARKSIPSKNVAVPMMARTLRCHSESGSRSMRPKIGPDAAEAAVALAEWRPTNAPSDVVVLVIAWFSLGFVVSCAFFIDLVAVIWPAAASPCLRRSADAKRAR